MKYSDLCIGIDPSLVSTGICVCEQTHPIRMALICPHYTKKQQQIAQTHNIDLIQIDHLALKDASDAVQKEVYKTQNLIYIIRALSQYLREFTGNTRTIGLEAVAFNACGTIDVLAGLSYLIRTTVLDVLPGSSLCVASPTSIKKVSVGNGNAQKQDMIDAFLRTTGLPQDLQSLKGISDIADAYWISQYANEYRRCQNSSRQP